MPLFLVPARHQATALPGLFDAALGAGEAEGKAMTVTAAERARADEVTRDLNQLFSQPEFRDLLPRQASYRYWEGKNGHQYQYTTEPVRGKFWAQEFKPVGAGARTFKRGKNQAERLVQVRRVGFVARNKARARAYDWYQAGGNA